MISMNLLRRTYSNSQVQAFTKLVGMPGQAFIGGPVMDDPADSRLRHQRFNLPYDGSNPGAEYQQIIDRHQTPGAGPLAGTMDPVRPQRQERSVR